MIRLLGLTEITELIGISKQNAVMRQHHNSFPEPIAYVGTRPAWALEQAENMAQKYGFKLNYDILINNEENVTIEDYRNASKKLLGEPPFFYFGITEAGKLLHWSPMRVNNSWKRGTFPDPDVSIGKRSAWSLKTVSKFANQEGITIADVPNDYYKNVFLKTDTVEYSVVKTYTGKWAAKIVYYSIKKVARQDGVSSARTVKEDEWFKVCKTKEESVNTLCEKAIEENLIHFVSDEYRDLIVSKGYLVKVVYRFNTFYVYPKEEILNYIRLIDTEDIERLARDNFIKDTQSGIAALDLRTKQLSSIEFNEDELPIQIEPIVYLNIKSHCGLELPSIEEQLNEFYQQII